MSDPKDELKRLEMELKGSGVCGPSKIRLWAAVPAIGEGAIILNWDEPDNDIFQTYSEMFGSPMLEEYGLDDPPGQGVWVFEGTVTVRYSRGGDPFEPQDWDSDIDWEGEWRPPNDDENSAWAAHEAENVTKDYDGEGSETATEEIEAGIVHNPPKRGPDYSDIPYRRESSSDGGFCVCGKHVSECCCGEDHSPPHHPSGRAYDEEDYEQFYK